MTTTSQTIRVDTVSVGMAIKVNNQTVRVTGVTKDAGTVTVDTTNATITFNDDQTIEAIFTY